MDGWMDGWHKEKGMGIGNGKGMKYYLVMEYG
jgi:hypothetical protein